MTTTAIPQTDAFVECACGQERIPRAEWPNGWGVGADGRALSPACQKKEARKRLESERRVRRPARR